LSFGAAVGGMLACAAAEYDDTKLPNFFLAQDAPILLVLSLFLLAVAWAARNGFAPIAPVVLDRARGFAPAWVTALVAGLFIWAASRLVYQNYALSLDEFMADFDARIIAGGRLLAAIGPEWRDYVPALQPLFRLNVPDNAYWVSFYLPM